MKKYVSLLLGIILLVAMFAMTGCAKQSRVVLTVDGYRAVTIVPAAKPDKSIGVAVEEKLDGPTEYTINGLSDGDNALYMIDFQGNAIPFTLKIHNGKVEAEAPEGITIHAVLK